MSTIKASTVKNLNSEEYCLLISKIYYQLKELENTMKHYCLKDSLYFIQLAEKCFENEVTQEEQINQ